VEFCGDLWLQKTRVPGLSCGVVCVILRLSVLVELRLVTDGRTDGRTDRQTDRHRPTASTADAQHRAVKKTALVVMIPWSGGSVTVFTGWQQGVNAVLRVLVSREHLLVGFF